MTRKKEMSMLSRPKGNEIPEPRATTSTQAESTTEVSVEKSAGNEDIRRRAYEIYLERGEQTGAELDDWLRAERELQPAALSRAQTAAG
jgi:hypothetical protein